MNKKQESFSRADKLRLIKEIIAEGKKVLAANGKDIVFVKGEK